MLSGLPAYVLAQINEPTPADPAAPATSEADFVVFGDSQGSIGWIWPVAPSFSDVVSVVSQIDAPMAFHVGDMYVGDSFIDGDVERQAGVFLAAAADLDMPLYTTMGNHDASGRGWQVTKDIVFRGARTYYSFDSDDSHFVVLDAYLPGSWSAITGEQLAWLEQDLRANTRPHVFVFVHPPLYSLGWHKGTSLDAHPGSRDELASLLLEHEVDIVFNGHEHFYASFGYGGLMQITTGGGGAKLRSPAPFEELEADYGYDPDKITRWKAQKQLHYVCVDTSSEGIAVSAYDLEGALIDHFVLPS
jgi:hypothetical protein